MLLPQLAIVIPCYNEEQVLPLTYPLFADKLKQLQDKGLVSKSSYLLFVDDGSSDQTWQLICDYAVADEQVRALRQSRNRGHQNTVLAGLLESIDVCDITISIDADGQDDLDAMDEMVSAYLDGADVVYGVRNDRSTDSFFKRFTAESFYRVLNAMGVQAVFNHADYRLISARVLKEFANFKEVNLFLRGMVPLVGFKSTSVYYSRAPRLAGESHYPFSKMLSLAIDGITSLSVKPLRFVTGLGLAVSFLAFLLLAWIITVFFLGKTIPGWASMTAIVAFMSGIQLLSLGIIGEYVGKIYLESKGRPRYIISERVGMLPPVSSEGAK
ncbi:glycosyltransferase, group 2 family protein [Gleimia coleocanis DSM 15436]|uniref:Glycosyltransferase, group 2 family protein n=1 Tax=Gleimia coleocanis DSM 15436 TaxID=525245 RepID=C0VZU9_9ACTO|nr:glycosyltransferase family 2 protein [Gleimia coleocanis]EEH63808.1 glycosyltransferase, group 2 family protein [Gleimia coleocanis DSM 15436]